MITLEDIIEELVERLRMNLIVCRHIFIRMALRIVGGGVPMNVIASALKMDWFKDPSQLRIPILAEWFSKKLGRPPRGERSLKAIISV